VSLENIKPDPNYRPLVSGDIIQSDDEFLDEKTGQFSPLSTYMCAWMVGVKYGPAFVPGRRRVSPSDSMAGHSDLAN
jgi:hypothetical protein